MSHNHKHHHDDHCHHDHCHSEGCACGHEHVKENKLTTYLLYGAIALFAISLIKISAIPEIVYSIILIISAALAAYPVILTAIKSVKNGKIDENTLMMIAVIAAAFLGEFRESAAVAIFFRIGEAMEELASKRSRDSIRSLSEIQVDKVNVVTTTNEVSTVEAKHVPIGTRAVIYPHETVPLDCIVIHGNSSVDASAITGESIPIPAERGTKLLSGMINGNETLAVKTTNTLEESTASRIIRLVEEASSKKGNTQKMISRIAAYYTPAVVALAIIVAVIPSLVTGDWATWIHRALVLLVASCPCALVLSVPLAFFTSMGTAARSGILVKGSKYIEQIAEAQAVVFDKTGTLTTDSLAVSEVSSPVGLNREVVLTLAAVAEGHSQHPIAKAIKEVAPKIDEKYIQNFKEVPGHGASAVFAGKNIICGSKKLLNDNGIETGDTDGVLVAVDGKLVGIIKVKSEIRPEAQQTVMALRESGIGHIAMLTGDSEDSAKEVALEVDADNFYASLLPEDKLNYLEEIKAYHGKTIYVGDGINDAPVLAAADVGAGMGFGSQAAVEAADLVLTTNNLGKLVQARQLAVKTMKTVKINIGFIMAVKVIVLLLGIIGIAPMWLAVFADVGVCLISVIISSTIASDDIKSTLLKLIKR
ncbi:MAG: cadmium-translocating P-type ATPase [Clostridia bacterium]|nr:cadmium-translocating P-type ATPase [Clostridia bacterium]